MATRLYPLNANSAPWGFAITSIGYPAGYYGTWNKVPAAGASSTVNILHPVKYGSGATTTSTQTDTSAITPYRAAVNKWISVPLKGNGTISGTLDLVLALLQSNADADFTTSLHVWVSQGTTPAIRGTLLANYEESLAPSTEWPTVAEFRGLIAPVALTPVDYLEGDRLVVEIGFTAFNAFSTSRTATIRRGAVSGAPPGGSALPDATVGSLNVTTEAGFIEFSQTLTFIDAPANDLCVNATVIPAGADLSTPYEDAATNTETATWSSDDPAPSCSTTSVYTTRWWTWTAPSTTNFRFGMAASGNQAITAYTGTCGAFVEVACNAAARQFITFAATMGTTYYIQVAGQFAGGALAQRVRAYAFATPTNDVCTAPAVIAALPATLLADASIAADDTFISANFSMREFAALFYEWTCPVGFVDNLEIDTTGSLYASQICVTTGACAARTEITNAPWTNLPVSEGEFQSQAKVVLRPTPGTTYLIRFSNGAFVLGGGILRATLQAVARPTNELASGAIVLPQAPTFVTQSNRAVADCQDDSTLLPPSCVGDNDPFVEGKYLWFVWTPSSAAPVQLNTAFSQNVESGLAIYTGSPGALTEVFCSFNEFGVVSGRVIFTPVAGTAYYLRVWANIRTWCTLNLFIDELRAPLAGDIVVGCGAVWILTPEGAVRDYRFLDGFSVSGIPTNGSLDPEIRTDLYVSQLGANQIAHLDVTTQPMTIVGYIPTAPGTSPEGNSFVATGQLLTGFRAATDPADDIRQHAVPAGVLEATFNAAVVTQGTGWIDLAADRTTVYYTSAGRLVKRYSLTEGQLADFATLPATGLGTVIAQGMRILPDGGVVVADYSQVTRTDANGVFTRAYAVGSDLIDVHVLDIDPEGETIWVGVTEGNHLYRIDLATGDILLGPLTISTPAEINVLCGVAVVEGQRAIVTTPFPIPPVEGCPARLPLPPSTPGCVTVGEL